MIWSRRCSDQLANLLRSEIGKVFKNQETIVNDMGWLYVTGHGRMTKTTVSSWHDENWPRKTTVANWRDESRPHMTHRCQIRMATL